MVETESTLRIHYRTMVFKKYSDSPDQCGSLVWHIIYTPKGCRFESQSGHTPRLWVCPLSGHVQGATDASPAHQCVVLVCFPLFLSPSILSSLGEDLKKKKSTMTKGGIKVQLNWQGLMQ